MCAPERSVSANPTAQEVLAYPVRQGAMATTAMPRRRRHRSRSTPGGVHRRFRLEWDRQGSGWGTLMRHFLLFGPIPALAFGVSMTTDRKSTRLNSSHANISYAVFC